MRTCKSFLAGRMDLRRLRALVHCRTAPRTRGVFLPGAYYVRQRSLGGSTALTLASPEPRKCVCVSCCAIDGMLGVHQDLLSPRRGAVPQGPGRQLLLLLLLLLRVQLLRPYVALYAILQWDYNATYKLVAPPIRPLATRTSTAPHLYLLVPGV